MCTSVAGGGVKALHTTKVATLCVFSGAAGKQWWCDQWDGGGWGAGRQLVGI